MAVFGKCVLRLADWRPRTFGRAEEELKNGSDPGDYDLADWRPRTFGRAEEELKNGSDPGDYDELCVFVSLRDNAVRSRPQSRRRCFLATDGFFDGSDVDLHLLHHGGHRFGRDIEVPWGQIHFLVLEFPFALVNGIHGCLWQMRAATCRLETSNVRSRGRRTKKWIWPRGLRPSVEPIRISRIRRNQQRRHGSNRVQSCHLFRSRKFKN